MSPEVPSRAYYACHTSPLFSLDGSGRGSSPVQLLLADREHRQSPRFALALSQAGYCVTQADTTDEVIDLLSRQAFDIIVAEVASSGVDGFEVLRQAQVLGLEAPVVLTSEGADIGLARKALHLGADDFVQKPTEGEAMAVIVERNLTRQAMERRQALRHRTQLEDTYETILDALLCALDFRSSYTEEHTESVTACSLELARRVGIGDAEMYDLERGALLHDIGKIGVPDDVLHKPGKLTPDEWLEMRKHPVIGYRMCSRISFLKRAAEIVLRHHEHWDGGGYPDGLSGEDIPRGARILAVVDAFHAMTSDRPYRPAMAPAAAARELQRCSGSQFDPDIVAAFLEVPPDRWMAIRRHTEVLEAR